jgi:hypothetical protein
MAAVRFDSQAWSVTKWTAIPAPGDQPPDSFCVVNAAVQGLSVAALLAADPAGPLYMQTIDAMGAAPLGWRELTPSSPGGEAPTAPLRLAPVINGAGLVVALDSAGAVHLGKIGEQTVEWTKLQSDAPADVGIQPVAVMHKDKAHVIVANPSSPPIAMLRDGAPPLYPPAVEPALGKAVSIACLPAQPDKPDLPLVAVVGTAQIMLWSDPKRATVEPPPVKVQAGNICSVLAAPGSATGGKLVLGAPDERLLHANIEGGTQTLSFSLHDALAVDVGTTPDYRLAANKATKIEKPPLAFANDAAVPVAPGTLKPGTSYLMLSSVPGGKGTGEYILISSDADDAETDEDVAREAKRMVLDDKDKVTIKDDRLLIDAKLYLVRSVKDEELKAPGEGEDDKKIRRVATLYADLPDNGLDYESYRGGEAREFNAANQWRLLKFEAALPGHVKLLEFAEPADPEEQTFTRPATQPEGENWVRVDSVWSEPPVDGRAGFDVPRDSIGAWTQVPLPRSTQNPELSWEYFDGRGWRRLDREFSDRTANLASSGSLHFTVPEDLSPTDVAGKQDYWIRARLVGGDYGRPTYVVETNGNRQSIVVDRSTLNPPEIFSIEASYELQSYVAPQLVLTVNNLAPVDQTQAAAAAGAEFDLFEGLAASMSDPPGLGRAIYIGLSRAPEVDPLSLHIDSVDIGAPALRLQAEVLRPEGWAPVVCDDGTAGLARPGLLRLFLSTVPAQLPLFGLAGWWIRLRPVEPATDWAPVVKGLHLNAVMAEQAKSLRQEILGSSLGAPDQSYTLAEPPVLPETLELRVRESLSDEEKAALTAADPEAVAAYADIEGEWIRWRATDSFVGKDGPARVFRVDPSTGEVRFGNGRNGMIPPAGRDVIRAVGYQSGGGSRGNVSAFAVNQLKTALESVELAVNPVDAGGGADPPPKERLAETAPARLRHAGRALTPPDIEALATGSSPDVVRARCLRGSGCSIDLAVAIRKAGERCPVPSRARREGIARNLAAAGWGALAPEAIRVRPPNYVHIRVEAVVIARSADGVAQVENDVRTAIVGFLHPIDGGPGGLGWPFARRPWPSDVQRVAVEVAGVDRVVDVLIAARDAGADLDRLPPDSLVCADEGDIRLVVQPPRSPR